MKKNYPCFFSLLLSILIFTPLSLHADERTGLSDGKTIYVPAYSHIYIGDHEKPFLLTVTLSIRNTDPEHPTNITTVNLLIRLLLNL